jgi:heterodisulfide reductase subunit A-like polyferredoxin
VSGIEFKTCTTVFDAHGRFDPRYDETVCRPFFADTVIVAAGQEAEGELLASQGILLTDAGSMAVQEDSLQTPLEWVFAGGDAVYGPKTVVDAVASGKRAAQGIDRYLRGREPCGDRAARAPDAIARRPLTAGEQLPIARVPVPRLTPAQRRRNFDEVEQGYSESQALMEAGRCLACGPCSECLACVRVCTPNAIQHDQPVQRTDLQVGAVVCGDDRETPPFDRPPARGVYPVAAEDPLSGSAAAGRLLERLSIPAPSAPTLSGAAAPTGAGRIGVLLCECGQALADFLDFGALQRRATSLPDVVHVRILTAACTPEGEAAVKESLSAHDLTGLVLAACSCCAQDQICYSCTFQRMRCKLSLGMLGALGRGGPAAGAMELVNVREQCAWVHPHSVADATQAAIRRITAAAAVLGNHAAAAPAPGKVSLSAAVLGRGRAAPICEQILRRRLPRVFRSDGVPTAIQRSENGYLCEETPRSPSAQAVVLAPRGLREAERMLAAFGKPSLRPRVVPHWGGVETHRPGVFFCDPAADSTLTGAAAAARVAAWLAGLQSHAPAAVAVVDPHRCRECGTCTDICEFGAALPAHDAARWGARIDRLICRGCGVCAAHCPSGAITVGRGDRRRLSMALAALSEEAFPDHV